MMRRLRYDQAMRRARWALLDGDVQGARAAARDAYRHRRTLRAAAVIVALRMSPEVLRSIHPAKNRAQNALRRARFRLAGRRAMMRPSRRPRYGGLGGVLKRGVAIAASGVVIVQGGHRHPDARAGSDLGPEEVGVFAAGSVLDGFRDGRGATALVAGAHSARARYRGRGQYCAGRHRSNRPVGSLAALAVSPLIGTLFHSERVGLIAAASSGLMLLHSLSSVPDAMMQRAFHFTRRSSSAR